MDDAWQSQDLPPANAIGIPTGDAPPANGHDDQEWANRAGSAARSPPRQEPVLRRNSRSRSPGRVPEPRGRRGEEGQNNPGNNLHVSGLSYKVDTRELEAAFARVGRVQKASVMYDPHSRESRGFGFVTMESPEEAEAAIAALNATEMAGKIMTVERARRGRARTPTPGRYYGPPKRGEPGSERPYDPRPYDSRYARDVDRRGGPPRYDDYPPPRRDYDRGGYGGGGRYDDRGGYGGGGGSRYDDRRYDDRRY